MLTITHSSAFGRKKEGKNDEDWKKCEREK
jgi:hypothetical protein